MAFPSLNLIQPLFAMYLMNLTILLTDSSMSSPVFSLWMRATSRMLRVPSMLSHAAEASSSSSISETGSLLSEPAHQLLCGIDLKLQRTLPASVTLNL